MNQQRPCQQIHLYDANLHDLEGLLHEWGEPPFRARQLYQHLYRRLEQDVGEMSNLPRSLRERLAADTRITTLHLRHLPQSADGQTQKALFTLCDDRTIETVLMRSPERTTVCVSTQAGCGMGCTFCATARMGLLRNLTSGEIIEQVIWAARSCRTRATSDTSIGGQASVGIGESSLTNIVFMGMGEPFANYDAWWAAVERLHDPDGFNCGARRMTVSTVGLVPGIRRLTQAALPINLAISLHAPTDALRSHLMPVNNRYPLATLLGATRDYCAQTKRRVSFEYVLIGGQNDTPKHAQQLAALLRGGVLGDMLALCHINLIPWNPIPGEPFSRSDQQRVRQFQRILQTHCLACTIRVERGIEIAAACGQLAGGHTVESLATRGINADEREATISSHLA